jgi:hypothetical protein
MGLDVGGAGKDLSDRAGPGKFQFGLVGVRSDKVRFSRSLGQVRLVQVRGTNVKLMVLVMKIGSHGTSLEFGI